MANPCVLAPSVLLPSLRLPFLLLLLLAASLAPGACGLKTINQRAKNQVVQLAADTRKKGFTTALGLCQKTTVDLVLYNAFVAGSKVTIFSPTNAAFVSFRNRGCSYGNAESMLRNHGVPQKFLAKDFPTFPGMVASFGTGKLRVEKRGAQVSLYTKTNQHIATANIVQPDAVKEDYAVVHGIDAVLSTCSKGH